MSEANGPAKWKAARRVRQWVQVTSLGLFLALLVASQSDGATVALADLFFRLDPLAAAASMLSTRAWIPRLGLALLTVLLALLVGRAWCGWICPLGTLLDWVSPRQGPRRPGAPAQRWRSFKYFLLAAILVMAVFGSLALVAIDPLALLTRTMTTAVLPALNYAVTALEKALYRVDVLEPVVDAVEGALRGRVLPTRQPAFSQNSWIFFLFAAIVALNWVANRFWCRYLCPLGGLLGLLARLSLLRPVAGPACNHCTRCALVCPVEAIHAGREQVRVAPAECTLCLDCLANCKKQDMSLQLSLRPAKLQTGDLTRREALGALGAGLTGVLLLQTELVRQQAHPFRLRPPGAQDESAFLSTCLRCSQCMATCPTTALQPAAFETGLEGLWTPLLTPRVGYCDYSCNACGQVCPSGAIPALALEEKRTTVLGHASVDRDRCLPWASGTPCIVCEEMCPTPQKSIRLEEVQWIDANGAAIQIQRPYVIRELCIGCGICENRCPLEGQAGIRVYGGEVNGA